MYDFCISPIYASVLLGGGLYGFVKAGSVESLALGGGAAAALALLSYVSLQYYTRGHLCKPATTAALAVAAAVGWAMHGRYVASGGKFMPAGAVAATSGAMVAFYAWSLALGPLPPVGKGSSSKGAGGGGGKGKAAAAASRR